jgi:regulator of RNase E activity RraA
MTKLHVYDHLDPMETISTRGAQGHNHLEAIATNTNGDVLVVVGDGKLRR